MPIHYITYFFILQQFYHFLFCIDFFIEMWYNTSRCKCSCEFVTILTQNKTKEQKMKNSYNKTRITRLCLAAIIAALYVALTMLSATLGLASNPIQLRISEALCILPYFTPAAIPGVTVGCLISNIILSGNILDIVFGTLATLIGAVGARLLRKSKWLVALPTVAANTLILPFVLKYMFALSESVIFFVITIFIGEFLSAGLMGTALLLVIEKRFKKQ